MHLFGLFVALAAGVGVVAGQHHDDPFAGSNCTCATFCDDKCAINPSEPRNITLYVSGPISDPVSPRYERSAMASNAARSPLRPTPPGLAPALHAPRRIRIRLAARQLPWFPFFFRNSRTCYLLSAITLPSSPR